MRAQAGEGEEEGEEVHVLEDVMAGSVVEGLAFQLLDEQGQATCQGLKGKKQAAWSQGNKKLKLSEDGSPEELPPLTVRTARFRLCCSPGCPWEQSSLFSALYSTKQLVHEAARQLPRRYI